MLWEIMVPLDGTRFAEAALPTAIRLARRDGARLRLVSAWEPPTPEMEPFETGEDGRRNRPAYLEAIARRVSEASGAVVTTELLEGDPAEVLARRASDPRVDLVVMTTHARGPVSRALLGSVADHMVRGARPPVLVIRPDEADEDLAHARAPFRRILIPLDGSRLAESVLGHAVQVGGGSGDVEYTLLGVVPFALAYTMPDPPLDESGEPSPSPLGEERAAAEAYLGGIAEKLESWGHRARPLVVVDARAPDGIVTFAEVWGADLIALATHGRGGISRALLGSVADEVVRRASMPVLTFRPEPSADEDEPSVRKDMATPASFA